MRGTRASLALAPLLIGAAGLLLAPASSHAEASLSGQAGPPDHKLVLWYRAPATNWMTSALPIGNGRLGGMIYGGVAQDHIQFNEKTLWTGDTQNYGSYQSFGDIYLDFPGLTSASNYRRELDLEEAISRVSYSVDSTQVTREYFVSYPDNVMAVRLSSSSSGNVSVDVSVTDAHGRATAASGSTLTIAGKLDLVSYEAQVQVLNEGGSLTTNNNKISVRNADAVTILLAAGTDYDASKPTYKGDSPHGAVGNQVASAAQKSYSALKASHLADYQALFNRLSLNLGETTPTIPTTDVITKYASGPRDPFLEVLYFQFGRYLTLSSSRGLGLPSNLQGIWNNDNNPPWSCDIHNNINVEMNYWPADPTNLAEGFAPYSDWLFTQAVTREAWRSNASANGNGGFSMNTQNNIFGFSNWEYNPEANAWFSQALWDHYRFNQDAGYLKNTAYPFMKGACDYWLSALITDSDGKLVAPNSFSPEHGNPQRENGTTYAQTLIFQLFTNTIKASQILGADSTYRSTLQTKLGQLDPGLRLGANVSANGVNYGPLLREWKYQNDQLGEQHRHISHLVGLYPGDLISPLIDTTYANAAKASLIDRGDAGTGWSRAWKVGTWARLLDGNHAKILLENALTLTTTTFVDMSGSTGGIYENLLDAHPPFQIDGNFGTTAGIAEMLLQSQLDSVHLLPALPDSWPAGTVNGLVARGNFTVSMSWKGGIATDTTITSNSGTKCVVKSKFFTQPGGFGVVRLSDGSAVTYTRSDDTITFGTTAGEKYRIASSSILAEADAGGVSGADAAAGHADASAVDSAGAGADGGGTRGDSGGLPAPDSSGSSGGTTNQFSCGCMLDANAANGPTALLMLAALGLFPVWSRRQANRAKSRRRSS